MTKDEALKMALEAFKEINYDQAYATEITAIKQVLTNEALERKAENARELDLDYEPDKNEFNPDWDEKLALTEEVIRLSKRIEELEAQPKQEPVCEKDPQGCWNVRCQLGKKCKNTPPQRTFVGLTKKEFQEAVEGLEDLEDCWVAIESALRSKNHG